MPNDTDKIVHEQLARLKAELGDPKPMYVTDAFIKSRVYYDHDGNVIDVETWWTGGDTASMSGELLENADPRWVTIEGGKITFKGGLVVQLVAYEWPRDVWYVKKVRDA